MNDQFKIIHLYLHYKLCAKTIVQMIAHRQSDENKLLNHLKLLI